MALPDDSRGLRGREARKIALLLLVSGALLFVHYFTPAQPRLMFLHSIHRHLLYIPIILAAFWYGLRGGAIAGGCIFLIYFPHIANSLYPEEAMMHHMAMPMPAGDAMRHWVNLNHVLECSNYLLIGILSGYLIDRLRKEEERLKLALDGLRRKAGELFAAEEQLRRADRLAALGQLSTGLAHEIRNPLGSIRGAAEILGDDDTPPARRAEFSAILVTETERLNEVLTNFLDYARSQKAGSPDAAEIGPVLDRLLALLGPKIDRAGISIRRKLASPLPALALGETLLQQILFNLVLNAVQSMDGGGELSVEAAPDVQRGTVTIFVSDTGMGISSDAAPHIFDPFFTTKSTGTGLGLAIVHKIATSQNGRVWLEATTPAGSRFGLELPVA